MWERARACECGALADPRARTAQARKLANAVGVYEQVLPFAQSAEASRFGHVVAAYAQDAWRGTLPCE